MRLRFLRFVGFQLERRLVGDHLYRVFSTGVGVQDSRIQSQLLFGVRYDAVRQKMLIN